MRYIVLFVVLVFASFSTVNADNKVKKTVNKSNGEQWISLMDASKWKGYKMDKLPPHWTIAKDLITCKGEGGDMACDIITKDKFADFELTLEWKLSSEGNSGIMYHILELPEYNYTYESGPEYQLLDDLNFPGKETLKPGQFTASDYDMYPAPKTKILKPVGEWNVARIVFKNHHVVYYLNGSKTAEFNVWSDDWFARRAKSKWANITGWGMAG
ncbi:MAG: DUF1080 domain-containing protein, partial [Bacteroidota bacterium]|nr:DUF1080 domain-containing protein [Bacteroidota bacterium]